MGKKNRKHISNKIGDSVITQQENILPKENILLKENILPIDDNKSEISKTLKVLKYHIYI